MTQREDVLEDRLHNIYKMLVAADKTMMQTYLAYPELCTALLPSLHAIRSCKELSDLRWGNT